MNHANGWAVVDDETLKLIRYSSNILDKQREHLTLTFRRLVDTWGFSKFTQHEARGSGFVVPTMSEIQEELVNSGYNKVAVDYVGKKVNTNGVYGLILGVC